jgi:hypothetical protein
MFCINYALQTMLKLTLKFCRKLMYYIDAPQCLMHPLFCCCRFVQNRNGMVALVGKHTLLVQ